MVDPCRNPSCEFYKICPLRPIPLADLEAMGAPLPGRLQMEPTTKFRIENCIGILSVNGSLDDGIISTLNRVESALPDLAGLYLQFDCNGGFKPGGLQLEALVLEAKQMMPVVVLVERAFSAAVVPAVAADQVLIAPGGEMGAIGSTLPICDGTKPRILISCGSPLKQPNEKVPPSILADSAAAKRIQSMVDREHTETVRWISWYRKSSISILTRCFDGGVIDTATAVETGLVDGIFTEPDARGRLRAMIQTRKRNFERSKNV